MHCLGLKFVVFYRGLKFTAFLCAGSQENQDNSMNIDICSNHEECEGRSSQFKLTKGFSAKESVKGHMASYLFISLIKNTILISQLFYD